MKHDTENGFEKEIVEKEAEQLKGYGVRHQQCLVLFFCLTVAYSMRSCMGVSLVAMIHRTPNTSPVQTNKTIMTHDFKASKINNTLNYTKSILNSTSFSKFAEGKLNKTINLSDTPQFFEMHGFFNRLMFKPPYPKFSWTKKQQDLILSSFHWGYMILQLPAGQLAHRFGARILLTGALSINCVVSFCTPWAAYYGGWISVVVCRVLQGLSQACIVPGFHTFFGKWAPLEERARLAGFALGGQALGTVLGLPITGFLASSPLGWPGIFRFYGILSGVIAIVLWTVIADNPSKHNKISDAEKSYIERGLGQKGNAKHLPVPWAKILRSRGLYAIIVAHIGQTWGQVTLYSEVPVFMDKVMGVNIKANGLLTALPFFIMWITNFLFSWITDMLIVKKIMSVTNARKFANSIGCIPPAIGLVVLAFIPKNIYVVESVLVFICAFKIAAHVGFQVSHIDITPNFAGTLMSISNFVSNLVGSQAPIVAGFILTDVSDELLWRKVFFVSAGMYFFTNLVYVVFGTAELADWNEPKEEKEKEDEEQPMMTLKKNDSINKSTQ